MTSRIVVISRQIPITRVFATLPLLRKVTASLVRFFSALILIHAMLVLSVNLPLVLETLMLVSFLELVSC